MALFHEKNVKSFLGSVGNFLYRFDEKNLRAACSVFAFEVSTRDSSILLIDFIMLLLCQRETLRPQNLDQEKLIEFNMINGLDSLERANLT